MRPSWELIQGDCLRSLEAVSSNSVDAIVTDPPYGLSFMGKAWDYDVPKVEVWREVLRVLKPGGHLLSFFGSRTPHRGVVQIEDAGFEVRDSLIWMYGVGFPKSLNVSADDRFCQCGAVPYSHECNGGVSGLRQDIRAMGTPASQGEAAEVLTAVQRQAPRRGVGHARPQGEAGLDGQEPGLVPQEDERTTQPGMEGRRDVQANQGQLRRPEVREVPERVQGDVAERRVRHGASPRDGDAPRPLPRSRRGRSPQGPQHAEQRAEQPGAVPEQRGAQACGSCGKTRIARGLGTALKPAHEPIVLARKPLVGTVAANVLAHGTGGLNIDGCRIGTEVVGWGGGGRGQNDDSTWNSDTTGLRAGDARPVQGRWPANVVLDEGLAGLFKKGDPGFGDSGGASRFFYTAKADRDDRDAGCEDLRPHTSGEATHREDGTAGLKSPRAGAGRTGGARNHHPTVKPVSLMRWLVRLVTPPGGLVLDPFCGSGSTGVACLHEGFRFLGIEREAEYLAIARARLTAWAEVKEKLTTIKARAAGQMALFAGGAR